MHWVYALYLFMCTAHAPVFLTLLAVGKSIPSAPSLYHNNIDADRILLSHHHNNNNTMIIKMNLVVTTTTTGNVSDAATDTITIPVESCVALKTTNVNHMNHNNNGSDRGLSFDAGIASLFCAMFAVMYMTATTANDSEDNTFNTVCNQSADTAIGEEEPALSLLVIRVIFWCFVWFHACLLQSIAPNNGDCYFDAATIQRTFAIWCLCRAVPRDKGWVSFGGSVCMYIIWITTFVQQFYKNNNHNHNTNQWIIMADPDLFLFLMQILVDGVLVLGHRYDSPTTLRILLNVRLFYMAIAGCLIHVLAFKKYYY